MEERLDYKEKNGKSFLIGVFTGIFASLAILAGVLLVIRMRGFSPFGGESGQNDAAFLQNLMNKAQYIKEMIDANYYYDYNENELADAMFDGMLGGIGDKYAAYYDKDAVRAITEKTEGRYCGIGVAVQQSADTGEVTVIQVSKDSPAQKASMEVGDVITGVDGKDVANMDMNSLISCIKGEEGTQVEITVRRQDKSINLTVTRAFIETISVSYNMDEGDKDIAYISISGFEENTPQQFKAALNFAKENNAKGLIFDVRNNPGGTLTSVLAMLDMLIGDGLLVGVDDRSGGMVEYKATATVEINLPMVILINQNTASAAELFTAALKDYEMATLIGKKTYGKGVVQTYRGLPDGTALKFTTAKYFTPKGKNIDGEGIAPDVEAETNDQYRIACEKLREKITAAQ